MNVVAITGKDVVAGTSNSSYTYRFPCSVNLDNHSVALASLTIFSCYFNVTAALANNVFTITIYPADA